jgi:hypothetical protein
VERSIRAIRERAAGKEPKRPEAFFDWDRDSLLSALRARIDRKQRRWQGGYQRRVLVMCTNEFFCRGQHFKTGFLPMCFGLSYDEGCTPVFHFACSDGNGALRLRPYLFVARYDVYPFAGAMVERYPSRDSMTQLILKRAAVSRPSGQWQDDDYDVLEDGVIIGRLFKVPIAPAERPWMWASGHNGEIRHAAQGYLYLLGAVDDRLRKSKDALHRRRESGTVCVLELLVRWRVRRVIWR